MYPAAKQAARMETVQRVETTGYIRPSAAGELADRAAGAR